MKYLFSVLLTLAVAVPVSLSGQNNPLPDVEVTTLDGEKVNIRDLVKDHKLTVINFWATWCKPCRTELENIVDLYPDWQEDYDVNMIAVSIDDAKSQAQVEAYVNGKGLEYDIALDPNSEFFKAVNGDNPPLTLICNRKGEILKVKLNYLEGDEWTLDEYLADFSETQQ